MRKFKVKFICSVIGLVMLPLIASTGALLSHFQINYVHDGKVLSETLKTSLVSDIYGRYEKLELQMYNMVEMYGEALKTGDISIPHDYLKRIQSTYGIVGVYTLDTDFRIVDYEGVEISQGSMIDTMNQILFSKTLSISNYIEDSSGEFYQYLVYRPLHSNYMMVLVLDTSFVELGDERNQILQVDIYNNQYRIIESTLPERVGLLCMEDYIKEITSGESGTKKFGNEWISYTQINLEYEALFLSIRQVENFVPTSTYYAFRTALSACLLVLLYMVPVSLAVYRWVKKSLEGDTTESK